MNDIQLAIELVGRDQGATVAVERVSRGVEGLGRAATAPIRALGGLAGGLADIGKNAVAFAAGGALLNAPGALLNMARAAAEDEAATGRLSQSLRNLGGDVAGNTARVNEAIAAGQRLAFSDDDVRDSFVRLAASTGDANQALERQRAAMDLARGAGIPLEAATRMLGRINEENVDVFRRMGIVLGENATEADALAAVQARFGGQADAYAKSTAGQFEQAQIAFAETQEAIGAMVLPALSAIGNVLVDVLPRVQEFVGGLSSGVTDLVGPALESLSGAFEPIMAVMGDLGGAARQLFALLGDGAADVELLRGVLTRLVGNDGAARVMAVLGEAADFFRSTVMPAFTALGEIVARVLAGDIGGAVRDFLALVTDTRAQIVDAVLGWARAMVEWIVPMIPDLLDGLGQFLQEMLSFVATNVSTLVDQLAVWAASFIDWIAPQIPGLLRELGAFVASMFDFLISNLPAIMEQLAKWGLAFVEWVAPRIPPLLAELGKLLAEVGGWIISTAMPKVVEALARMAAKFVEWVATDVLPKLPGALATIGAALATWASGAATAAARQAASIGESIVRGIADGIGNLRGWLGNQISSMVTGMIDAAKRQLRISSPSAAAADEIGRPFVMGIGEGMIERMPWLVEQAENVAGAMMDAYIAEIDRGAELSRRAWENVASYAPGGDNAPPGLNPDLIQTPSLPGDPWGEGPGGGGGGGGGSGGGSTGNDGRAVPGSHYLMDPEYQRLAANAGWHAQVPGKGPLDFGGIAYDPLRDTERGHGTPGTNKDKSGHYRVLYRIHSLFNAGHERDFRSALSAAVSWVRANTPPQYWGGLGWTVQGRQHGGPALPGRSYLVGERGPELLHMGRGGGFVQAGGGGATYITIHVAGSVVTEGQLIDVVHAGLLRKQRRNVSLGLT